MSYWIEENIRPRSSQFICSGCEGKVWYPQATRGKKEKRCKFKFCPWCGEKMESYREVK